MRSATRTFLELAHNHLNPSYVPFPHCFLEALLWPLGLFLLISPRLLNTHRERNVNFFLKLLELWMLVVSAGFPQRLEVIVVVIWWYTNKIELKRKIELFNIFQSQSTVSRVEREYAWSGVIRPPEHSLESLCTVVHDNEDDVLTYQRRSNAEPQVQEEVTLKRKWTKSDKEVRNKVILKGRDNFKLGVFLVGFFLWLIHWMFWTLNTVCIVIHCSSVYDTSVGTLSYLHAVFICIVREFPLGTVVSN